MSTMWNVLIVDDDKEICQQITEFLQQEEGMEQGFYVESVHKFEKALGHIRRYRVDAIILDIRSDDELHISGLDVLSSLKGECFVPVIFYTGLPSVADGVKNEVVKVVDKTDGLPALKTALLEIMDTGIPTVHRLLTEHMQTIEREYMWTFLADEWIKYSNIPNRTELAYLLAKRLSRSFEAYGIDKLAELLPKTEFVEGDASFEEVLSGDVSPMQYYIVPPIEKLPLTGDLYRGDLSDGDKYWMVLTPSCDFWQGKVEHILLAECDELTKHQDYEKWERAQEGRKKQEQEEILKRLMMNRRTDRTFFFPGFLDNPNLVADFCKLRTVTSEQFQLLQRVASLDSAFAGKALSHFIRFYARYGTPNLNTNIIMAKLGKPETIDAAETQHVTQ